MHNPASSILLGSMTNFKANTNLYLHLFTYKKDLNISPRLLSSLVADSSLSLYKVVYLLCDKVCTESCST